MSLLKSLTLSSFIVTHDQLENVTTFLSSRVTMIQIHMNNITCNDHRKSCPGVQFHLSEHDNLQMLGLHNVPVSQLQVNTQHLEECNIGRLPSSVIISCLTSLPAAHNLHRLHCGNVRDTDIHSLMTTLQILSQLEELYIYEIDLTDNRLVMTTDMTRLKQISLYIVSMKSSDLQFDLINTISSLSQSVGVLLVDCTVTPETEYETVKEDIRKSNSFTVTFDGINRASKNVFRFHKSSKTAVWHICTDY
jgi:hypothetical protein